MKCFKEKYHIKIAKITLFRIHLRSIKIAVIIVNNFFKPFCDICDIRKWFKEKSHIKIGKIARFRIYPSFIKIGVLLL